MDLKSNIPKILLQLGTILIFISLFFVWFSYIYISGERKDIYGYERDGIIIILTLSIIINVYVILRKKVDLIIFWVPFLELGIYYIEKSIEVLVTDETVYEEGIGWIFALIGIILQLIGVIIGILLTLKKKETNAPPTDRSEQVGEYR